MAKAKDDKALNFFARRMAKCPTCPKQDVSMAHVRVCPGNKDRKLSGGALDHLKMKEQRGQAVAAKSDPVVVKTDDTPAPKQLPFHAEPEGAAKSPAQFLGERRDELGGGGAAPAAKAVKPDVLNPDGEVVVRGDAPKPASVLGLKVDKATAQKALIIGGSLLVGFLAIRWWTARSKRIEAQENANRMLMARAAEQAQAQQQRDALPKAWNPELGGFDNPAAYVPHAPSEYARNQFQDRR